MSLDLYKSALAITLETEPDGEVPAQLREAAKQVKDFIAQGADVTTVAVFADEWGQTPSAMPLDRFFASAIPWDGDDPDVEGPEEAPPWVELIDAETAHEEALRKGLLQWDEEGTEAAEQVLATLPEDDPNKGELLALLKKQKSRFAAGVATGLIIAAVIGGIALVGIAFALSAAR